MRDRVLIISFLAYFTFLGSLWALYVHGSPTRVTIYDQVAKPGERVSLAVKLEKDGPGLLNPDLKGKEVLLTVTGPPAEAANDGTTTDKSTNRKPSDQTYKGRTDDDGTARFDHIAPAIPGAYRIEVRAVDAEKYTLRPGASGHLHVLEPGKPILVCDIDDTVTRGEGWKLFVPGKDPSPQPGASQELTALAKSYEIIFLTARDDALLNVTRSWLALHGFPKAPVMGRDWHVLSPFTTGANKLTALAGWKQRFGPIAWGIGNSKGDRHAYAGVKTPHIIIGSDDPDRPDAEVPSYSARDWTAVAEIFRKLPEAKKSQKDPAG